MDRYLGGVVPSPRKDMYVLSTNVDTQIENAFPAERVCNYQGSFARLQCRQPCCDELFVRGDGRMLLELGVGEMTPGGI